MYNNRDPASHLENWNAVYAFSEVPEPEGGVFAAGDDQPLGGVAGSARQLHVVTNQAVQQNLQVINFLKWLLTQKLIFACGYKLSLEKLY